MKNIFYTYAHIDPRTNEVRYVGKGKDRRAYSLTQRSGHHKNWIQHLKSLNLKPIIQIIKKDITEIEALHMEILLIDEYKREGIRLTNSTNGGEGSSGYKHTEKSLLKMSELKKGKDPHNKGKPSSKETKKRLSDSHKGIFPSKETRIKLSESKSGKKNHNSKQVIDITTGFVWDTLSEASRIYGIKAPTLCLYLNNESKNKTNLRYIEDLV